LFVCLFVRKCGFESVPRYFHLQYLEPKSHPELVRKIEWKTLDNNSKSRIKDLFSITSKMFDGVIVRNRDDYWDLWVAHETPVAYLFCDQQQQILGYILLFCLVCCWTVVLTHLNRNICSDISQ
jgi:hypothetical protein